MKWTIVGFYPKLQLPYGAYIGADTAQEAVESCLLNARKNWPPEQQVVITAVVQEGGLLHKFGLLSSRKGATVKTALLPESALSRRLKVRKALRVLKELRVLKKKAKRELEKMRIKALKPV